MKVKILLLAELLILGMLFPMCTHDNDCQNTIFNAVRDVDGNIYDAICIGDQVWMKTNLRTKHFRDGTDIPIGEKDQYDNALPLVYERVAPGYDSKIYGLYYNWPAVNDDRGLCPQGWHVPSDDEWTELVEYVGSKTDWYCYMNNPKAISKALASPNGWIIDDDEGTPGCKYDDNNATGFSAIPAGNCNWLSQGFCCAGYSAEFWSSTKVESCFHDAWVRSIKNDCENVFHYENHMDDGLSVRCLRD